MTSPFSRLDTRLRRLPDVVVLLIAIACIVAIAAFKVNEGRDVLVVDFLLIPVAAVGWLSRSRWYGYVAALAAASATVVIAIAGSATAPVSAALGIAAVRLLLYLIVLGLIGAMRRMQAELDTEARTDHQTGAANSRAFRDIAAAEIERSRRYGRPLSLLYMDVDDFKAINDSLGHAAGDRVLLAVSHVMRCSVRAQDTVARLGGDEFVVLMPETDRFAAGVVAKRVQDELSRVVTPEGETIHCSIGVATMLDAPASVDELLHAADRLMYRAKRAGKDRVETAVVAGGAPRKAAR
jgi:diguanylate cyclase (GGDEF)-like protein